MNQNRPMNYRLGLSLDSLGRRIGRPSVAKVITGQEVLKPSLDAILRAAKARDKPKG